MVAAQQRLVILSLSKDLGSAVKENIQRLSCCSAKILRLRTPCSAQNDNLYLLLHPAYFSTVGIQLRTVREHLTLMALP